MDRVRESAEAEGRVWSVMYDISGVKGNLPEAALMQDWKRLVSDHTSVQNRSTKERLMNVIQFAGGGGEGVTKRYVSERRWQTRDRNMG